MIDLVLVFVFSKKKKSTDLKAYNRVCFRVLKTNNCYAGVLLYLYKDMGAFFIAIR
jgi:hypothetical protein